MPASNSTPDSSPESRLQELALKPLHQNLHLFYGFELLVHTTQSL